MPALADRWESSGEQPEWHRARNRMAISATPIRLAVCGSAMTIRTRNWTSTGFPDPTEN